MKLFQTFDVSELNIKEFRKKMTLQPLDNYYVFFKDMSTYFLRGRFELRHTWDSHTKQIVHEFILMLIDLQDNDFYDECDFLEEIKQYIEFHKPDSDIETELDKVKSHLADLCTKLFSNLDRLENFAAIIETFSDLLKKVKKDCALISQYLDKFRPKNTESTNLKTAAKSIALLLMSLPLLTEIKEPFYHHEGQLQLN